MVDPTLFTLFALTAFVILITPGPAVLYIVARSIDRGRVAMALTGQRKKAA